MKSLPLILLICSSIAAAGKIDVERDGKLWNVTVSGSVAARNIERIAAAGDLTVRGVGGNHIGFVITRRFAAPSEAAARAAASSFEPRSTRGELIFDQSASIRVEVPRTLQYLSIASAGGSVDAGDLNGSVRADTSAGRITLDRIAGDAEVHSSGGPISLGSIGGVVRCYSGGGPIRAVRIRGGAVVETDGGDIQLGEVMGVVQAITGAGGIRIDRAGSQVFADTFGGPISILRALGFVVATSSGGPIDVGEAPSVQCRSASGTIRLNNVSGRLRAATDRGSIVAEIVPGHPLEDSFLSTRGGDITVLIPSNTGVTIEAEIEGSRNRQSIVSDFSGLLIADRASSVLAKGKLNGGGPVLKLTGAGGRIEIRRK